MAEYSDRELTEQLLTGVSREDSAGGSEPRSLLTKDDGTLRVWVAHVGLDSNGDEVVIATELTGEQRIVNYGKDSDGNVDPFRTNADQQLQVDVITSAMLMAQLRVITDTLEKIVIQLSLITDVTL